MEYDKENENYIVIYKNPSRAEKDFTRLVLDID